METILIATYNYQRHVLFSQLGSNKSFAEPLKYTHIWCIFLQLLEIV